MKERKELRKIARQLISLERKINNATKEKKDTKEYENKIIELTSDLSIEEMFKIDTYIIKNI